ncbi:uncharacterized protein rnf215 isoform X7 [Dunckerocampus dactyliophorus]|uniref:uncharacterized protein rnf215 isoform X7 n=1 Tax=Dunckerocampus dactyliophorus TaxID=161453 RepID=UPI0024055AF1|nr:uncharacterized protein rnf215 isoform X7 [Dunckerocampus dactyliophorus]
MAEVRRCLSPLVLLLWPAGLLMAAAAAEQVAVVEVYPVEQRLGGTLLRGEVVAASAEGRNEEPHHLEGELVLIQGEEPGMSAGEGDGVTKEAELWIGVLPVDDSQVSTGKQESFTETVVSRMKRALVLGASALIILALNQNTVREGSPGHCQDNLHHCPARQLGRHAHTVVQLRPLQRGSLWRVAGRHLHGGDQLTGAGTSVAWARAHLCSGSAVQMSLLSLEVPAAALGHCPAGGAHPQHGRHRSGPLAVPGPAAKRQLRGHPEDNAVPEDQNVPSAQTLVRDRHLRRVSGGIQQQPVSPCVAVPTRVPSGLRGPVAAAASHLPAVQAQHPR